MRSAVFIPMLLLAACVPKQPVSTHWQLTRNLLIPPGVPNAEVARRTFTADVKAGGGKCPPDLRVRNKRVQVTMSPEALAQQPAGWLTAWTEKLQADNCIASGEAATLADSIIGSLPLDPNLAFKLIYATDRQSGQVDLGPEMKLQVVSPILAKGAASESPALTQTTGSGNTLGVTITAPDMVGYQTAVYNVKPKPGSRGFAIATAGAEQHIGGQTTQIAQPAVNYLHFSPRTSYYRLYYKAGETGFTALVVGAPTREELKGSAASCDGFAPGMCVAIPKQVAVNPLIEVTVNGEPVELNWGSAIGTAIRAAGERQPESILPRLRIFKPHDGRLAEVVFDRSDHAVLDLVLRGGESLSWK